MQTRIDEIADRIYRLATFLPPVGLTFNQYLVLGEQPLLFHCGHRRLFAETQAALARVLPPERLRWISFGHIEADESGALQQWLDVAPQATVVHGSIAVRAALSDMIDRSAHMLADDSVLDLGGKRVRWLDTPHVPHGWEAGLLFEETSNTLLCGDLFTHTGDTPPLVETDLVAPAMATEDRFGYSALAPTTGRTLRRLADLQPTTLAVMHGAAFAGDGGQALRDLAGHYDQRIRARLG